MVTNEWDHPAGYTFWVGIRFRNSTSRDFQNGTTCGGADAAGAAYSGSRFPWSLNPRDRGHPAACGGADAAGAAYSGSRFPWSPNARDRGHPAACRGADAAGAAYSGSRFPWSLNARDRGHPAACGGADAAGAAYSGSRLPWSPKVRDQGHPSSLGPWFPAHAPEKGARTGHGAVSVGLSLGGLGIVHSHLSRKERGEGGAPRRLGHQICGALVSPSGPGRGRGAFPAGRWRGGWQWPMARG
jgi:hypothetical protein